MTVIVEAREVPAEVEGVTRCEYSTTEADESPAYTDPPAWAERNVI